METERRCCFAWALGTMGHRGHSPFWGFFPAECRNLPAWHWSELRVSLLVAHPQCPAQGQSQGSIRGKSSGRTEPVCPHWQPGSANRKMLSVLCSVMDVLPQCTSTARVLTHLAHGTAQGSQCGSNGHSRLDASVRSMLFLHKHNATKAKVGWRQQECWLNKQ